MPKPTADRGAAKAPDDLLARLRALCLALPEAGERISHGATPTARRPPRPSSPDFDPVRLARDRRQRA
jgi:hypothetical protein